jgi:hypothetical protein
MNLGDEVEDTVTGFKGVILARLEGLHEATSCRVHPTVCAGDTGKPIDSVWMEESRLRLTKLQAVTGFLQIRGRG